MEQEQEKPTSRNIPLPIQRAVRQRCGFGCVVCGLPLYEYEHMEGWANVHRHVAEEITLLCDKHHKERTNRLLPIEQVRKDNADPFNLRKGVTKPYDLHFSGNQPEIVIGGNTFTVEYNGYGTILSAVVIDTINIVGFVIGDDHLLLNLVIFDQYNERALWIRNNQLLFNPYNWDIQLIGTTLTLREGKGEILLEIEFQPPNRIIINRAKLLKNGIEILVRPTHIFVVNNQSFIRGTNATNVPIGLWVGTKSASAPVSMVRLTGVPRYNINHKEAFAYEKKCMGK